MRIHDPDCSSLGLKTIKDGKIQTAKPIACDCKSRVKERKTAHGMKVSTHNPIRNLGCYGKGGVRFFK